MELFQVPEFAFLGEFGLRWNRVEITNGAATVNTEYSFCCICMQVTEVVRED